jgi:hypothetical protein
MILVFSQKSGTGLLLHNLLHTQHNIDEHPTKEDQKSRDLGYTCTCIDDFFMPFAGSEEPVYSPPVSIQIIPNIFFEDRIPFTASIHTTLRGPPVCIA